MTVQGLRKIALGALGVLCVCTSALASHAFVSVCCTVPSALSVIDRSTHRVAQSLIAAQGADFVTLTSDGQTAYVLNASLPNTFGTNVSISVLDAASGAQIATIPLTAGMNPYGSVLSPDGTRLYVLAAYGSYLYLLAIDTGSNAVLFDDELPGSLNQSTTPLPLPPPAISADGNTIYIDGTSLMYFDVSSQTVTATVPIPQAYLGLQGFAVTPDDAYAVVTANNNYRGNGQLALVDLSTQTIVKSIQFGIREYVGPAVCSPDGSLVYFIYNDGNINQKQVKVFDVASQQVVSTLAAGTGEGRAIAITPDGSEIDLGSSDATVVSIDTASGALTGRTATLGQLISMTVSPDGNSIYVPGFESSIVNVIDPATGQVTNEIAAGWITSFFDKSYTLRVSANGTRAAVSGNTGISVIDVTGQRLIGVAPVSGRINDVVLSADGSLAYVAEAAPKHGVPKILAINTRSLTVARTLDLSATDLPTAVALSPNGSTLYVSDESCPSAGSCVQQVLVIATANLQLSGQIQLSTVFLSPPGEIAITSDGMTAYVANPGAGVISVVDLTQGTLAAPIAASSCNSSALALAPNQQTLYVLPNCVIDLQQQTVIGTFPDTIEYPSQIAVSPEGTLIYVTDATQNTVEVFRVPAQGPPTLLQSITLPGTSGGVAFTAR